MTFPNECLAGYGSHSPTSHPLSISTHHDLAGNYHPPPDQQRSVSIPTLQQVLQNTSQTHYYAFSPTFWICGTAFRASFARGCIWGAREAKTMLHLKRRIGKGCDLPYVTVWNVRVTSIIRYSKQNRSASHFLLFLLFERKNLILKYLIPATLQSTNTNYLNPS